MKGTYQPPLDEAKLKDICEAHKPEKIRLPLAGFRDYMRAMKPERVYEGQHFFTGVPAKHIACLFVNGQEIGLDVTRDLADGEFEYEAQA